MLLDARETFHYKNVREADIGFYYNEGLLRLVGQSDVAISIPINWLDNPYNHRSWMWKLNNLCWLDDFIARYKFNNDIDAIRQAISFVFDWLDFYVAKDNEGEFKWKDDAVSFRVPRLVVIYFIANDIGILTEEESASFYKLLELHFEKLIDPKQFKKNNHGVFQMRALACLIAVLPQLDKEKTAKAYITEKLDFLWKQQFGTQDIHLENSPAYHIVVIKEFESIVNSRDFAGFELSFNKERISRVKENASLFVQPDGFLCGLGDTNPYKIKGKVLVGDHIYNESGYAVFGSYDEVNNQTYLIMRTGFPSNIHRHSDDFSFEWFENGERILTDSGRFSYDYDSPYRKFVTSTRAHNTVEINGENYPWWGDFKRSEFYSDAVRSYTSNLNKSTIEVSKVFGRLGVQFDRKLVIEKGKSIEVHDRLTSENQNEYTQWFHFADQFALVSNEGDEIVFQSKINKVTLSVPSGVDVLVMKGAEEPFIQGWCSPKERALVSRYSIGFRFVGKNASICSIISVSSK